MVLCVSFEAINRMTMPGATRSPSDLVSLISRTALSLRGYKYS